MARTLIFNGGQAQVVNQLDTYNYTAMTAGLHVVAVALNVLPASGMSIVIQKNGSAVATSVAPTATQEAVNLSTTINAAVNDVLTVILSSSVAIDQGGNAFKGTINIHRGSSN